MLTNIPESITTLQQAKDYLTELYNNCESYHPEDNAFSIVWGSTNPTEAEMHQLNKAMSDIYKLTETPEGKWFDPCEFLVLLHNCGENIENTL